MIRLKPHRQRPGFCGPSSLKVVLDYYGIRKTESELGRMTGCSTVNGTPSRHLLDAARRLGLKGFIKDGASVADLREWVVGKKVPVIVNWFSVDEGHYSVVVHLTSKSIWMMDPELGRVRRMALSKFEGVWFDFSSVHRPTRQNLVLRRMVVIHPK